MAGGTTEIDTEALRQAYSATLRGDESVLATIRPRSPAVPPAAPAPTAFQELVTLRGDLAPLPDRVTLVGGPEHAPGFATAAAGATATATDRAPRAIPSSSVASDFELVRELGRGGMGVVYLATQRSLGRPVAVKALLPELQGTAVAERFATEAAITGRLEHPGIPPVHAFGCDAQGRAYLAMKLVNGVEWSRLLHPGGLEEKPGAPKPPAAPLDQRAHLEILRRVCDAVGYAHSHCVVHRDLKPENVMVGEFGEVLVMDWGIALDLKEHVPRVPGDGELPSICGTPAYLAPEMAQGREDLVGAATDVFLLGGILYEILTGSPPYGGKALYDALVAAATARIDPPAQRAPGRKVPDALAAIAMRALEREPSRRFADATGLSRAIGEYLRHEGAVKLADAALAELDRAEIEIASRGATPRAIYGRLAGSVAALRQSIEIWPGNRDARAGLLRARLAYAGFALDQGDLALAEAQLAEVPEGAEGGAPVRARHAAVLAERERRERRRMHALYALGAAVLLAAVGVYWSVHETRLNRRVLLADHRRAEAVREVEGIGLAESKQVVHAWQRAVEIDPTWVEAQAELGRAFLRYARTKADADSATRNLLKAVEPFDRALAMRPEDLEIRISRAYLREARGDWPGARADCEAIVRADAAAHGGAPGTHAGFVAGARLALAAGKFDEAVKLAARGLEPPYDVEGMDYIPRAVAYCGRGDFDDAQRDVEKAIKESPHAASFHAVEAMLHMAAGDVRDGLEALLRGVRVDGRCPPLVALLRLHAEQVGDRERADALAGFLAAVTRERAQAFPLIDPFFRALTLAPTATALPLLARAVAGDLDFAAMPAREPAASVRARQRGEGRFAKGDVEGAFADAGRALAEDPLDGAAVLLHARCLAAFGHRDAARLAVTLVHVLAPNCEVERNQLIEALKHP